MRPTRTVTLPLGATEDRVVGTVDVRASMKAGVAVLSPGVLAEANRNVLYLDEINLLDEGIRSVVLGAVGAGGNNVEREGISVWHPVVSVT